MKAMELMEQLLNRSEFVEYTAKNAKLARSNKSMLSSLESAVFVFAPLDVSLTTSKEVAKLIYEATQN